MKQPTFRQIAARIAPNNEAQQRAIGGALEDAWIEGHRTGLRDRADIEPPPPTTPPMLTGDKLKIWQSGR